MIRRFLVLIVLLCLCCNPEKPISASELKAYAMNPKNGLRKTIVRNEITLELVYRPKDLILLQEVAPGSSKWMKSERDLDSLDYFVLRVSKDGEEIENSYASDAVEFEHVLSYLSDGIASDFQLVFDKERIKSDQSLFVQAFGSAEASSILLVFKSYLIKRRGQFTVVFNDSELGVGHCEFPYNVSDIRKIPGLQY
jgi:hypothetical protein